MQILSERSSNSSSGSFKINKPLTVLLTGTFDGALVKLEVSPDDTNWIPASPSDASFSEPQALTVNMYGGLYGRLTITNAGASTSISANLYS